MKNPLPEEEYKKRKREKDYSPRSDYFRDQTAIIHSMPFRRLKHKFSFLRKTIMYAQE